MSATPDPAELAPTRDPAAYGRRPLFTFGVLAWLVLCLVCLVAGAAVGRFGLRLAPAPQPVAAPEETAPRQRPLPVVPPAAASPPAPTAPEPPAPASIGQLADRVARLEGAGAQGSEAAMAALAAAELSEAAQSSSPFDQDLAAYQRLLPASPELRALAPLALRGAPTRAALTASLPMVASQASAAARQPARDASALSRLATLVGRVLVVRRIDPDAPGVDGILARAERQAAAGDLDGAVAGLKGLPAAARAPLEDWLGAADRRIEIDRRLAALRARALAGLAQAPAP